MELTMSEKIKILAKRSNIALFQVAERSGQTRQNLANKLSRNDFKISELKRIADALGVSLAEVYGVATFYSQFSLTPKGKYKIGVCLGTACYVKGSGEVYEELQKILGISGGGVTADGAFSLDATRCIGCCGLAPVMTVNEDVYGKLTVDSVAAIIDKYRAQ